MDPLGGLIGAIILFAAAWLLLIGLLWLYRPSRELAGQALRVVPDVIRLVRALVSDPTTPRSVRFALGGLLIYLLSPIDIVPDFLPGIGALDDLIVTGLVLRWAGRRVGLDGLRVHWSGTEQGFALATKSLGTEDI